MGLYFVTYLYGKLCIFNNCCSYLPFKYCLKTTKGCLLIFKKKSGKQQGLTELTLFRARGLDDKMMEETRNKWTLSKDKIEWDAVETIPILLYTDNFTLLSVYKEV